MRIVNFTPIVHSKAIWIGHSYFFWIIERNKWNMSIEFGTYIYLMCMNFEWEEK